MATECQTNGCRRGSGRHCAEALEASVAPPGYDERVEIHPSSPASAVDFCVLIAWLDERGADARFLGMNHTEWPVIAVFSDHCIATEFRLRWC